MELAPNPSFLTGIAVALATIAGLALCRVLFQRKRGGSERSDFVLGPAMSGATSDDGRQVWITFETAQGPLSVQFIASYIPDAIEALTLARRAADSARQVG